MVPPTVCGTKADGAGRFWHLADIDAHAERVRFQG